MHARWVRVKQDGGGHRGVDVVGRAADRRRLLEEFSQAGLE